MVVFDFKNVFGAALALAMVLLISNCGGKKEVRTAPPAAGEQAPAPTPTPGELPPEGERGGPPPEVTPKPSQDPTDPSNMDKDPHQKRLTGMIDPDGFVYTGSSPDSLLTFLRLRSEGANVDAGTKARNLDASRSVLTARILRHLQGITVTLNILEEGSAKTYVFSGVKEESRVVALESVSMTGSQKITAALKCLDVDGGCSNSMLRLFVGEPGTRAVVRILFRDTIADLDVQLPGRRTSNPEYEVVRNFWINSILKLDTDDKLKQAWFSAFEVVNGRSGFEIDLTGQNTQRMVFVGSLLAPDKGTKLRLKVANTVDSTAVGRFSYEMANSIGSAYMVSNDGLGQIKLSLAMRPRAGYEIDVFTLTVMRVVKPVLPLSESAISM